MNKVLVGAVILTLSSLVVVSAGEKAKFDGAWHATGGSTDGKKLTEEVLAKVMLVVTLKDNTYKVTVMGNQVEAGTWKLDTKAKPNTLDLTITEGENKGKKQLGLMKVDGEVMTVTFAKAGSTDRPKNFDGGEGIEVTVLKRKK